MANITDYLNGIKSAVYGKEVRGAIHDAIKQVYDDASVNHDNANMEVKMARGTHNTLNDRLDNVDEIQAQTNAQLDTISKQIETKMDKTTTNIAVSQINKNLGKFDQTYMTDEFLQQIVGNAPINAIPADYSITTKKLAFKPIEGLASKNLYDKNDVFKDTHINGNDGTNLSLEGYCASNFIPTLANEKYTISGAPVGTLRVAFYDSSKNFISKVDGTVTFTTPLNTAYVRISISSSSYLNTTQLEVGEVATLYEECKIKFTDSVIDDGTFDGKKIKHKTIKQEHLDFVPITGIKSKNLFNKGSILRDSFINNLTGEIIPMVGYFASDYILIDGNTTYSISPSEKYTRVAFYDMSKNYLSSAQDNTTTITTPSNAVYIRIGSNLNLLEITQFEKGSTPTSYVAYKVTINPEHIEGGIAQPTEQKLLYTFNDAWSEWNNNGKFPMAFFGDSTIDGMGTTGFSGNGLGIDGNGKSPNSFPVKLQSLLRAVTGNNTIRIYNAGFSGMKADWGLANIDKEFGSTSGYSDVKMVGIGFGINDRLSYKTIKEYREGFKSNIKAMIEWFYEHNIQPFLLTTQALVSSDVETQYATSFPLRTAMHIETVANEVKRELAKEYGLEIIDLHKFTTEFLLYSSYPTKTIIADRTHFGDIGHEYEAGVLFAHITPMVEIADGYTKIDFSSQKLKKGVPEELLTVPDTPNDSFKLYANYTKTDTTDLKIMDIYVFNTTRKTMTLKAFKNLSDSLTYVKLNGVNKNLSSLESNIGTLDLGVYHLEVWTGVSNKVDFKGFIIE